MSAQSEDANGDGAPPSSAPSSAPASPASRPAASRNEPARAAPERAQPAKPQPAKPAAVAEVPARIDMISRSVGFGARGTWLIFLYLASILLVVMTLTAQQAQNRIQGFEVNNKKLSIWMLERLANDWFAYEDEVQRRGRTIAELQARWQAVQGQIEELNAEENTIVAAFQAAMTPVGIHLALTSPDVTLDTTTPETFVQVVSTVQKAETVPDDISKAIEAARGAYEAYLSINQRIRLLTARRSGIETTMASTAEDMNSFIDTRKPVLYQKAGFDDPNVEATLQDFVSEVTYFRNFSLGSLYSFDIDLGGWAYKFWRMPSEMLTIILVLFMGVLGSTIDLTQTYFSSRNSQPLSYYVFRPVLGAITALAVFIVAKAGVIVVSDASFTQSGAPLSPFFISFLAIVSGLLANAAVNSIKKAGQKVLRADIAGEAKPRWARGVEKEIETAKKDKADLYAFFEESDETVDQWVGEKALVPGHAQRIVAAWLNKPQRDLFTDLAPANANEQQHPVAAE